MTSEGPDREETPLVLYVVLDSGGRVGPDGGPAGSGIGLRARGTDDDERGIPGGREDDRDTVDDADDGDDAWTGVRIERVRRADPALRRLAAGDVDCVVVETAVPDEGDVPADIVASYPGVPLVLYTDGGVTDLDPAVRDAVDSIVERSSDRDSRRLLREKVRSALEGVERPTLEAFDDHELLVNTARDGIYALDAAGRFAFVNESLATMLGYEPADLVGAHISAVQAPGQLEVGQRMLDEVLEDEESESRIHDMALVTSDGERIVFSTHFVVRYDDGEFDGIVGVMRDVTDRRRQERELRRQRERLDAFASMVAHDLRNPLSVLQGSLETFLETDDRSLVEQALGAATRMEQLIGDLLALARAGEVDVDDDPVDVHAAAEIAFERVDTPDATLELDSTDGPVAVDADEERLVQLLENLLANAVDHAGPDVTVEVGALRNASSSADDDEADGFYVADDGLGIPPDEREQVFEHGHTTGESGTGFGLSIVETIAEAHGWSVAVGESEAGGARFEVIWGDADAPWTAPGADADRADRRGRGTRGS